MDLRTAIGLLFGLLGVLLIGFGLTHAGPAFRPTGVNIDLDWGGVLLVFAAIMLLLARLARTARPPAAEAVEDERRPVHH